MKKYSLRRDDDTPIRAGRMALAREPRELKVMRVTVALVKAIRCSTAWREVAAAREAMERDVRFAGLLKQREDLLRAQRNALAGGGGFGGKELAEMIILWREIQSHGLHVRQERAWDALLRLFQGINQVISEDLGVDFASIAAVRRTGDLQRPRVRGRKRVRIERIIA